ncbi:hypothetical protein Enr13x_08700 [Stieleria neptunia]|uniref:Uncharacterized protein n=1 Tax=Stieleria neptunia TaxID=2527979 RepID=A0A518HJK8_9BACT|nr:hypothetical protein Enr13x_08700 [Stieleria neptunia]
MKFSSVVLGVVLLLIAGAIVWIPPPPQDDNAVGSRSRPTRPNEPETSRWESLPVETSERWPVERLRMIHDQTDTSFRAAIGFGRSRRLPPLGYDQSQAHLLIIVSHVLFIPQELAADPEENKFDRLLARKDLDELKIHFIHLVSTQRRLAYLEEIRSRFREPHDMERLADPSVATRPLNEFETAGLNKLIKGDSLVVERAGECISMLGAIRADTTCVECHSDASVGDILGAFSYQFKSEPEPL